MQTCCLFSFILLVHQNNRGVLKTCCLGSFALLCRRHCPYLILSFPSTLNKSEKPRCALVCHVVPTQNTMFAVSLTTRALSESDRPLVNKDAQYVGTSHLFEHPTLGRSVAFECRPLEPVVSQSLRFRYPSVMLFCSFVFLAFLELRALSDKSAQGCPSRIIKEWNQHKKPNMEIARCQRHRGGG